MNVKELEEKGFVLLEIEKARLVRFKVMGGMYEASARMKKDNVELNMFMFSHLDDETPDISLDKTKEHLGISGVIVDGKYMDVGWHCTPSSPFGHLDKYNKDLWCHKEGWFDKQDSCLAVLMSKKSWHKIPLEEDELKKLGFEKVI